MTGIADIRNITYSLAAHLIFLFAMLLIAPAMDKKHPPAEVDIIIKKESMAATEEKFIDLEQKGAQIIQGNIHRTKSGVAKKELMPVVGATEETVAESGETQVQIGNTLHGMPENEITNDVEYAPLSGITKSPSFRSQLKPVYPESARKIGIEGVVLLEVIISSDGNVTDVKIIENPGYGMGEAAREAILKSAFSPAMSGETPVAAKVIIPVRFRLVD